jgi:hypothetical protein
MGTMKVGMPAYLMRPHSLAVAALVLLFGLAVVIPGVWSHRLIGAVGIIVCCIAICFVGRDTLPTVTKIERANMVMFSLLFVLLICN